MMGDTEADVLASVPGTAVLDQPGPTVRTARTRELVLRRLLRRGVPVHTLLLLLPDWRELIDEVSSTTSPAGPPAA